MVSGKKVIIVDDLVKKYGKIYALKGISFHVYEGEILGLLGPNGAGKTTTLKAVAGAIEPTHGRVLVYGMDSYREYLRVRKLIGIVPELPGLSPELSVYDNLSYIGRIYGLNKGDIRDRIREISEFLGIEGFLKYRYGHLSKGLKRRVDIAAALIHDPKILLLDEPTTGLDALAASSLREYVMSLASMGKTIILSSHYIDEAMNLSHRIVLLARGVKLFEGEPIVLKNIFKIGKLVRFYLDKSVESRDAEYLNKLLIDKSIGWDLKVLSNVLEFKSLNVVEAVDHVRNYLLDNNYRIFDLEVIPPSWEDIFKQYIEKFSPEKCAGCPLARGGCVG